MPVGDCYLLIACDCNDNSSYGPGDLFEWWEDIATDPELPTNAHIITIPHDVGVTYNIAIGLYGYWN